MSTTQRSSKSSSAVPHERYEETNKKSYGSQQEVADAWAEEKYPTHNIGNDGAVLYTGSPSSDSSWSRRRNGNHEFSSTGAKGTRCNFYGVQHDDGSGTLWHYSTREAIRTADGDVISNQQCWSAGFAHCSKPDYDYEVPLDAVEEHLDADDTVFDIKGVIGQPSVHTYYYEYSEELRTRERVTARNSVVVIDGADGDYGIYVGRDSSIINGENYFTFRLSAEDVADLNEASDALDLLLPDAVNQSGMEVVDSSEYCKTRLDAAELEAHKEAGGNTTKVERSWRDDYEANLQHFRADLQGNVIVRHGEFFFIPRPDADPAEHRCREASEELGNHQPERFHGARKPLPTECAECGSTSFEEIESDNYNTANHWECENGHEQDGTTYVHGQIRHTSNDHNSVNLGDVWHEVVSHDRDVRTYDRNPGNGGGGGGWD